jgi:hypothetical protein
VRYNRNDTVVTDDYVKTADGTRYRIGDLRHLAIGTGPMRREPIVGLVGLAMLIVTCVTVSMVNARPNPILVGIAGTLILAVSSRLSVVLFPRRRHIVADHRGRTVLLFSSLSQREIGFVARAVQRAIERSEADEVATG